MNILALDRQISPKRLLGITILAWIGVLGFDLFLHGAILSSFYIEGGPFLLPPLESFKRIPIGYLSFLITTGLLVWLIAKLDIRGWGPGSLFGGIIGGAIWFALGLGLYSISTAQPLLLLGWFIGQTLEMAYAGGIVGQGLFLEHPRRLTIRVAIYTIAFLALTIIFQSFGLALSARIP